MNNLENQIINKLISLLTPLRTTYPNDIDIITNDLINNNYDSLKEFVYVNFNNLGISPIFKDLIFNLVDNDIIDESFIKKIQDTKDYEFIPFKENNILLVNSKPLNVKDSKLKNIQANAPTPDLVKVNHEFTTVSFDEPETNQNVPVSEEPKPFEVNFDSVLPSNNDTLQNNDRLIEETSIEETTQEEPKQQNYQGVNIDDLRKKILKTQLEYLDNAPNFIKDLETKDEIELYEALMNLNDLRYIQHSLSKLSHNALDRLYPYVDSKLEKNKHSSIDMFILDVIKKYLNTKMR